MAKAAPDMNVVYRKAGNLVYTIYTFQPSEEAGLEPQENETVDTIVEYLKLLQIERLMQSSLPSYSDLITVLGIFDIIIGLAHGIGFLNTENGNDCQEYLEEQQQAVTASIEQFDTEEGGDQAIKAYFEGINQIILIFWNINDTFTNCY